MNNEQILEDIKAAKKAICEMCSEGRYPKMRIPVHPDDEDQTIMRVLDWAEAKAKEVESGQ